jgi:hypothetical protein
MLIFIVPTKIYNFYSYLNNKLFKGYDTYINWQS